MTSSWKQELYWKTPHFLKNCLASLNAMRCHEHRYGKAYRDSIPEITAREGWTAGQFRDYQNEKLISLVRQAAEHVPFYRNLYRQAGVNPQRFRGLEDLPLLPVVRKQQVRSQMADLLDERLDRKQLLVGHTSGTTGTPLTMYRTAAVWSRLTAFFDARCRMMAGMKRIVNRSASIGGHLVAAPGRTRPPFWVFNRKWNQLYLSSYHLAPKNLQSYVDALRDYAPEYLEGYPSSLYAVARFIIDNKLPPLHVKAVFTTAETLFDYHREAFQAAFGSRTFNQYGCGEAAVFAAECPAGSLHLSPDYAIVEIVNDQYRPLPAGQTGRVICTSLVNDVQLFIRYELGDLAALSAGTCKCGRSLPVLESIEGRIDAVLLTRDGRRIGRLDPVFKGGAHVAEAQIVQDDWDKFRIRIVPAAGYSDLDGQQLAAGLADRVGPAAIRVEIVEAIERTKAGKFPAVVCNLSPEKREQIDKMSSMA